MGHPEYTVPITYGINRLPDGSQPEGPLTIAVLGLGEEVAGAAPRVNQVLTEHGLHNNVILGLPYWLLKSPDHIPALYRRAFVNMARMFGASEQSPANLALISLGGAALMGAAEDPKLWAAVAGCGIAGPTHGYLGRTGPRRLASFAARLGVANTLRSGELAMIHPVMGTARQFWRYGRRALRSLHIGLHSERSDESAEALHTLAEAGVPVQLQAHKLDSLYTPIHHQRFLRERALRKTKLKVLPGGHPGSFVRPGRHSLGVAADFFERVRMGRAWFEEVPSHTEPKEGRRRRLAAGIAAAVAVAGIASMAEQPSPVAVAAKDPVVRLVNPPLAPDNDKPHPHLPDSTVVLRVGTFADGGGTMYGDLRRYAEAHGVEPSEAQLVKATEAVLVFNGIGGKKVKMADRWGEARKASATDTFIVPWNALTALGVPPARGATH